MRQSILLFFLLISSEISYSGEVSLACNVQTTYNSSSGNAIKDSGQALVEITEETYFKSIFISSDVPDANVGVSTRIPVGMRGKSEDFSSKSKWEIHTTIEKDDGSIANKIIIDRVSGMLISTVNMNKNGRMITINIGGTCRKSDANNRKF